jgi:site-specific DNA recombinase
LFLDGLPCGAVLAAVYVRISDDPTGEGLGVARQERECRALCKRNGWKLAEVFTDNDTSAYRKRRRPAYERLLDALKSGAVGAVVAWHPDRLHRSPVELEEFIAVIDACGAEVATVSAGNWDLSSPSGRLVARQLGAVARYESEHKAERHRLKHDELFRDGKPAGGDRCFGFGPDNITHVPVQVEAIRWAAQHLLDGGSLRSVCSTWNTQGLSTTFGNPWQPWVVKRLVTSAKVGGRRERDGVTVDAVWEPILPWETVQRLRVVLTDPARRRNLHSRRYLLTGGVAVCGLCGKGLVARPKGDGRRCYVCASGPGFYGCGKIRCLADPLEDDVTARLLARLRTVTLPEPTTDLTPLLRLLDELESHQGELARDFYSERVITRGQFTAASSALMERISAVRREIAQAERGHRSRNLGAPHAIAASFDSLDFDGRLTVTRAWIARVVVAPAVKGRNFYDRQRVSVEWVG